MENWIVLLIIISDNSLLAHSKANDISIPILSNSPSDDNDSIVSKHSVKDPQHQGTSSFVCIDGKIILVQ